MPILDEEYFKDKDNVIDCEFSDIFEEEVTTAGKESLECEKMTQDDWLKLLSETKHSLIDIEPEKQENDNWKVFSYGNATKLSILITGV